MKHYQIVNRGDGPKIEGTRITVYQILEYLRLGRSRESMAVALGLSSQQVQAALDYIKDHQTEVDAAYEAIMERIRRGNPPPIEERLRQSRRRSQQKLTRLRKRHPEAVHAQNHGG